MYKDEKKKDEKKKDEKKKPKAEAKAAAADSVRIRELKEQKEERKKGNYPIF